MNYTKHTLSNGLQVILVPIQEVESATTLVLVGAGSRYEKKKIVESLIFSSTWLLREQKTDQRLVKFLQ
jgi:hypothetical protein